MKLLGALLLFIFLFGCTEQQGQETPNLNHKKESGINTQGMDLTVAPQDDFFQFVNGKWLAETEIPAEQSSWGSFSSLRDQSLSQLKAIVDELSNAPASLNTQQVTIYNLYQSYADEQRVEAAGLEPLKEEIARINALQSTNQLADYLPHAARLGIGLPLGFWVDQDAKQPSQYSVYFTQSGLGLPDKDYYFDDSERGEKVIAQYLQFISSLFQQAGFKNAQQRATAIFEFEKQLANHQWSRVANRDRDKTYNAYSADEFAALMADFPLNQYLAGTGLQQQQHFVVRQPDYFTALGKLYRQTPVTLWQDYLHFQLLNSFAAYLPTPFSDAKFNFYSRQLRGVEQQKPRWKRAIGFTNGSAGELLGQLYVAKHFPPEAKARMEVLVNYLFAAYEISIAELDWMSDATKDQALDKLAKFTPKIGYPDQWKDFSSLATTDSLVGNVLAVRNFQHQFEIEKLGQPVNRHEWFMPPQIVNAYYNSSMNEIVFPAAILQPPFFNLSADDAVNYGAIGGVIGHEIGHGFDDQGSKSNGDGLLTNWWSDTDRQQFDQKGARLAKQYNQYQPVEGAFVNGQLTLGENIGDLGGLSIALKAYKLSLAGAEAPMLDGFSGEQRVFLGWAQVWRNKRREQTLRQLLKTDPHSPSEFRVNGVVRNIDGFYKAFDVQPEHKLYLPPEQRVKIW